MMNIRVQLRGHLRRYGPATGVRWTTCPLPDGATVADLTRALGFTADEEFDGAIGERLARLDDVLHDGDEILLFPPLAGGQDGFRFPVAAHHVPETGNRKPETRRTKEV